MFTNNEIQNCYDDDNASLQRQMNNKIDRFKNNILSRFPINIGCGTILICLGFNAKQPDSKIVGKLEYSHRPQFVLESSFQFVN